MMKSSKTFSINNNPRKRNNPENFDKNTLGSLKKSTIKAFDTTQKKIKLVSKKR